MRWNRATVQPFLDVRTAVLNGTLEDAFRRRHPGFRPANDDTGAASRGMIAPTILHALNGEDGLSGHGWKITSKFPPSRGGLSSYSRPIGTAATSQPTSARGLGGSSSGVRADDRGSNALAIVLDRISMHLTFARPSGGCAFVPLADPQTDLQSASA